MVLEIAPFVKGKDGIKIMKPINIMTVLSVMVQDDVKYVMEKELSIK